MQGCTRPAPFLAAALAWLLLIPGSSFGLDIILVTNNEGTTQSLTDFLTGEGHLVTRGAYADGIPDAATLATTDLIIVTRETNSGDYIDGTEPADWNGIPVPIINMAPHLMRTVRWGYMNGDGIPALGVITNLDSPFLEPDHAIVSGLTTEILNPGFGATGVNSPLAASATLIATYNSAASHGLFVIPEDTVMFGANRGTAGAMRIGFISGNEGAWDNATANAEQMLGYMIEYTQSTDTDTDGDGIPDQYEVNHGLDPDDNGLNPNNNGLVGDPNNGAAGDPDDDGVDNITEFTNNTRADEADTDGDGYEDGVETNDGTFDDINTDTGTDPLNPDTDGDGLKDGVETNDGSFDGITTDTGTNPLIRDTDADNFGDGSEASRGYSPVDSDDHPTPLQILFLGSAATPAGGADPNVYSFLQDRYGITNVTYLAAVDAVTGGESSYDLLVLSSTPGSGDLRGKFHNSATPVVNWEEAISDSADGEFGMSTVGLAKMNDTTQMALNPHAITIGLPPVIDLWDTAAGETSSSSNLFTGVTVVGTAEDGVISGGNGTNGTHVVGNAMLFVVESGDAVDARAGIIGNVAPARRVMLPLTDATFNFLSADGRTLCGQAMDWAAGIASGVVTNQLVEITSFVYDRASDVITLRCLSNFGKVYQVMSNNSTDGSGDKWHPSNWDPVFTTPVPSQGDTTEFVLPDYYGTPWAEANDFWLFRISEKDAP